MFYYAVSLPCANYSSFKSNCFQIVAKIEKKMEGKLAVLAVFLMGVGMGDGGMGGGECGCRKGQVVCKVGIPRAPPLTTDKLPKLKYLAYFSALSHTSLVFRFRCWKEARQMVMEISEPACMEFEGLAYHPELELKLIGGDREYFRRYCLCAHPSRLLHSFPPGLQLCPRKSCLKDFSARKMV